MSRKEGKVGYMALKIDMEKAYDRLEWHFIRDILNLYKFPMNLIKLIMSCISSSSISVLFNGGKLDSFLPSRGIHQGDPLSPYLFIMCMEMLGVLIREKCEAKLWDPMKASRNGPSFSHLFFADDLVLFAKANWKNCCNVRETLDSFCDISGQKVSLHKSKVYFSPNVDPNLREELCEILGMHSTPNLGKYLGFPLKLPGSSTQDFNFVLDRVQSKLLGWKSKLLSMAGRVILSQYVISAIPSYVMQGCVLPNRVLNGIDRVNRNFLWGSTEEAKRMHMVNWKTVTKPKSKGGLGIYEAQGRNLAMAAKLCWRMDNAVDAKWAEVLKKKYQYRPDISKGAKSRIWAAVRKGASICEKESKWVIGSNSTLCFWHDKWLSMGTVRSLIEGPLQRGEENILVKDVICNGRWDLSNISFDFNDLVLQAILATPLRRVAESRDHKCWISSTNENFNTKNAYMLATGLSTHTRVPWEMDLETSHAS